MKTSVNRQRRYSILAPFYIYSYTFDIRFTIALHNVYLQDENAFRARYDDFLSSTSFAYSLTLAKSFGLDSADLGFWRGGFNVIREKFIPVWGEENSA